MIRNAQPNDVEYVVPLMIQAMEHLACKFVSTDNPCDAIPLFSHFFTQANNPYSYQNTLVFEDHTGVLGSVTGYDGACIEDLRTPVLNHLSKYYQFNYNLETETQAGEFYIDNLSVQSDRQGIGIATALMNACCNKAAKHGHLKAGLLVEPENLLAKRLYHRIGFKFINMISLAGDTYEHMQKKLN